jgi:hypothetical protein
VVEELVEAARTEWFFASADAAYQRLRSETRRLGPPSSTTGACWESTLGDGLGDA